MMLSLDEKTHLQEKIIDELFENILKKQPKGPAYYNSYLFKKIEDLFRLEVTYLGFNYNKSKSRKNDIKLSIKERIDDTTLGSFKYKDIVPVITIYTKHEYYYGILSSNPKTRVESLGKLLNVLFHELRHLKQYLLTQQNVSNKNVLRNAKEILIVTSQREDFIELYQNNHNDFAIEADAKIKATNKLKKLLTSDYLKIDDNFNMAIYETKRDYNEIVVNDVVYNRDALISEIIDSNLKKNNASNFFKEMPILLKEYNNDGSKKSISDLIINMKNELTVANFIKEEDNKKQIINDIKEFYYELIFKRLEENDPFELYEAIINNSKAEVYHLIENIKEYFYKEKKRTLKLLKSKCDAEVAKFNTHKYGRFPLFNHGKIRVNTLNSTELIDNSAYVKNLKNDDDNDVINKLFKSNYFISRIPDYGTYILKNNTKISVNAFVHNIFLKEYDAFPENKKDQIPLRYCQILYYYVKTPFETDYIHKCDSINRTSQKNEKMLNDILNLSIFRSNELEVDEYIYKYIKIVKDINKPEVMNDIRNYMLYDVVTTDSDDIYYSFTEEQLNYFNMLNKAAKYLNYNRVLNPGKIDYYRIFRSNDVIFEINTEIKRFNKTNKKTLIL